MYVFYFWYFLEWYLYLYLHSWTHIIKQSKTWHSYATFSPYCAPTSTYIYNTVQYFVCFLQTPYRLPSYIRTFRWYLNIYGLCCIMHTLGYSTYLSQGARAGRPVLKFLHIQFDIHFDIHFTYLLFHFISSITALSAIMSEWGIPVMPFKIFENIIFQVLVLFRSSGIRNTDHHFLIL